MTSGTRRIGQVLAIAAAVVLLGTPARAYYHYLHFVGRSAPYNPVPEAFDLSLLPNKTLTFSVSDTGPATYGPNDGFGSVLGQVKLAAAAWNSVASSDLRVAFGGLKDPNQVSNLPGGDVVFQDLPPGLLGMGTPKVPAAPVIVNGPNGPFLPISRGLVILTNHTDSQPGPSYLESFYTTAVHEFGHALGLQHTWTSAAMSQDVIRNTSRARPIDADDIAAISVLYGKASWAANYGSITGRVTANGQGVAMASVVAIPATGPAVSTLTNPDGTYTINGLPPETYWLYVHPLPPDAIPQDGSGLVPPADMAGQVFPAADGAFETVFYPGTRAPELAGTFAVSAGTALTGKDFAVQTRAAVPVYDVVTYSYLDPGRHTYTYSGSLATTPAYVDVSQPLLTIVAQANAGQTPVPRSVRILGGGLDDAVVQVWGSALAIYFYTPAAFPGVGPRHLVFNFGDDMYVLPDGINLVQKAPPQITSLTPNADGSVTADGTDLNAGSRIFFGGLEAAESPFSGADTEGSITVAPPAGTSEQGAVVTVFNSDGQNSMFWQAADAPAYTYAAAAPPQINNISHSALPAGTSAMVDITTANTAFVDGQVTVGIGTDDVTVRRVWVLSPTHLVANLVAAPNAALGFSELSVIAGSQVLSIPGAFQVQPAAPALPGIALPVFNGTRSALYAGAVATVYGTNLAQAFTTPQLSVNDVPAQVMFSSSNQVNFLIPPVPAGLAVLKLNNGSASAFPVALQIDSQPPAIQGVTNASGVTLDATHAANAGDAVVLLVGGVDAAVSNSPGRLRVTVAEVPMTIQQVSAAAGQLQVQFTLSQSFGSAQVPLVVSVDGSASEPYILAAR